MKEDTATLVCSFTENAGQVHIPRTCSKDQSRTNVGAIVLIIKIVMMEVLLNVLDRHIIITFTKWGREVIHIVYHCSLQCRNNKNLDDVHYFFYNR